MEYNNERIAVPEMRTGKIISEDKMKKLIMTLLVFALACLLLVGCVSETYEPQTFYKGKMSIQLDTSFIEKGSSSYDAKYASPRIVVYVTETQFSEFDLPEAVEELSTKEYAEMLADAYNTTVDQEKGLVTFTREERVSGDNYTFYTVVFKHSGSFWCIEFATRSESFAELKDVIYDYAWSVEFS